MSLWPFISLLASLLLLVGLGVAGVSKMDGALRKLSLKKLSLKKLLLKGLPVSSINFAVTDHLASVATDLASGEMPGNGVISSGRRRSKGNKKAASGVPRQQMLLAIVSGVSLLGLYSAYAQGPSTVGAVLIESLTSGEVGVRLPALPAGATSYKLQRATRSVTAAAPPSSGRLAWFKADSLSGLADGAPVSQWGDVAGGDFDATQGNPNWRPTYVANAVSGRPAVRFDGSDDYLALPPANWDFSGGLSAFVVARPQSASNWSRFFDFGCGPGNNNIFLARAGTTNTLVYNTYNQNSALGLAPADVLSGGVQMLEVVQQSGTPGTQADTKLFSNGAQVATGQSYVPLSVTRPYNYLGKSNWDSDSLYQGDISEIIFYNTALSDTQRQSVENYIQRKYAVGLSSDDLTWTDVASGLAGGSLYNDDTVSSNTTYWYRCVAQGGDSDQTGPATTVTTLPEAPAAPSAPTGGDIAATHAVIIPPALPARATHLELQQKVSGEPDSSYATVVSVFDNNAVVTGLTAQAAYAFRCVAVGEGGQTSGASYSLTTAETDPPEVPAAPSITGLTSSSVSLLMPALPTRAASLTLQRGVAASAAPASPPVTGLKVWLKADAIKNLTDGAPISSWPDSSGHNNAATQSDTNRQPSWTANGLNGRPSVHLNGSSDFFQVPEQTDIRSAFVVVRHRTGSQDYAPLFGSATYFFHGGPGSGLFSSDYTSPEVRNGQAFLNGQAMPATSIAKPTSFSLISLLPTGPVSVNALSMQSGTDARDWDGDYAEVLLYNTTLSTADRQNVEAYLMNKYGLGSTVPTGVTWSTIATGLDGTASYEDTGRSSNTRYFYRCVAVGSGGTATGPAANGTTLSAGAADTPPDPPAAPSVVTKTSSSVELEMPDMPDGGTTLSVQRATEAAASPPESVPVGSSDPPVSGLSLWLKADSLRGLADGSPITMWPDSSGLGRNVLQANTNKKPTFSAAAINGRPAVHFNGSGQLFDTVLNGPGGSELTFIVVAKGTQYQSLVHFYDGNGYAIYPWAGGNTFLLSNDGGTGNPMPSGLVANEVNIGAAVWKANTPGGMRTYRNGQLVAQRDTTNSVLTNSPLFIGADDDGGGEPALADVSEILVYNKALSDTQLQNVQAYLAQKYAVATPASSSLNWTTVATDKAAHSHYTDTGLGDDQIYHYRCVAVGPGGSTAGDSVGVATLPAAPAAPAAPTFQNVKATHLSVSLPALPSHATSLRLQRKVTGEDDSTYVAIANGLDGGASLTASGLSAATSYQFRVVAVGNGGETPGIAAQVTTTSTEEPGIPAAPSVIDTYSDHVKLKIPPLPDRANSLSLQRATAPVDAPSAPPSSGLKVWLKSDTLTGANQSAVSTWSDSSGNGNDATMTDINMQPHLATGVLAGKSVVRLDGVDDYLHVPAQTDVRTVIVVASHHTGSEDYSPILGSSDHSFHGGAGDALFSSLYTPNPVKAGSAYLDGQSVNVLDLKKPVGFHMLTLETAAPVRFDSLSTQEDYGGRAWNGDYAEVLVYDHVLSSEQRVQAEGYLAAKYGMPLATEAWNWSTIATGLGAHAAYTDTGLSEQTRYFYRCLAVGSGGSTPGEAAATTTLAPPAPDDGPPDAPDAPSVVSTTATSVHLHLPALPHRAATLSVQRAVHPGSPQPVTAGLQVWLKADSLGDLVDGDPISTWSDSSGHGNAATQNDTSRQPQWTANGLNGWPIVHLNGSSDFFQVPEQTDIRSAFVVVRHRTGSQDYAPLLGSSTYFFHGGQGSSLFSPDYTSPEVRNGAAFLNGQTMAPTAISRPTSFSLISLVTAGPVSVNSLAMQSGTDARDWDGDYAEVLLYNTALSVTERQSVESYLMVKYGLNAPASDLSWTTIATEKAAGSSVIDSNLTTGTHYLYRCVAVGPGGSTPGTFTDATPGTTAQVEAPAAPDVPSFAAVTSSSLSVVVPALPARATSLTLQQKLAADADTAFTDVATDLSGASQTPITGLTAQTAYSFRFVAVGEGGSTAGDSAAVTTLTTGDDGTVTAQADTYSVVQDQVLTVAAPGVLANDSGPTGVTLAAVHVSDPSHGALALASDGSFVYTPTAGFHGSDSFTYKASGGASVSAPATVDLTVTAADAGPDVPGAPDAPTFTDVATTSLAVVAPGLPAHTSSLTLQQKLAGDADTAFASIATNLSAGAQTPVTGLTAQTAYRYRFIAVGEGGSTAGDSAAVTTATADGGGGDGGNSAVTAQGDAYSVVQDQILTIAAPGVLANDSGPAGATLTASVESEPAHGTLTLASGGSFVYTPTAGFHGGDNFTYRTTAGTVVSAPATVSLTVTAVVVNQAPIAQDGTLTADEDTPATGNVTATDAEGDALSYSVVALPSHGTLDLAASGAYTYTPAENFNGSDSFSFKANDGADSNTAQVQITVNAVNDAPVAVDANVAAVQEAPIGVTLSASDVDGDELTYSIVTPPQHGSLSGTAPDLTYTPSLDFVGSDSFTFKANDGNLDSNEAQVSIAVAADDGDGTSPGFDALIRPHGSTEWSGDNIYNVSGNGQTVIGHLESGQTVAFDVRIENEGSDSRQLVVTGPATGSGWTLHYLDGLTGDTDITSQMTGSGWLTPALEGGGTHDIRVEMTSGSGASTDKLAAIRVKGQSGTRSDVVKAHAVTGPADRPDAQIGTYNQFGSDVDYVGDNIYRSAPEEGGGENGGSQVASLTALTGGNAKYFVLAQNDGWQSASLRVTGAAGTDGWSVHYFDARDGGSDITTAVTGDGWLTPELGTGESCCIRMEVSPGASASYANPFEAAVTVASQQTASLLDVVTTSTYHDHLHLDMTLSSGFDTVGEDVINLDGENQSITQRAHSREKVSYNAVIRLAAPDVQYRVKAPAGDANWTIRYFDAANDGNDITEAITGDGWLATSSGALQQSIRIEVTPTNTVGVASEKRILVTSTAEADSSVADAVLVIAQRKPALDALIRHLKSPDYLGADVYNSDGTNQTAKWTQMEGAGRTATFLIRVDNNGNAADTFNLKAPASGQGWILHYYDAPEEEGLSEESIGTPVGTDITAAITAPDGWTTASVEAGHSAIVRLEATPDTVTPGQAFRNVLVSATSTLDATATDAVQASTGMQKIVKLQYTLDQGDNWQDVPDPTGSESIPARLNRILGLRAVPLLPDMPWPSDPELKPRWDNEGYWNIGESIWIRYTDITGSPRTVTAECGNILSARIGVGQSYKVTLDTTKMFIPVGGGTAGQTVLSAKVTLGDNSPAVGMTVRFSAQSSAGTDVCTLGGGTDTATAVTNENGVATVTLTSGTQGGNLIVKAVALAGTEEIEASRQQLVVVQAPTPPDPDDN